MKSVLVSIQPQWCELIASGKKIIEVRKTAPKEVPFKAYIYMTATKERCRFWEYITAYQNNKGDILNGSQKVIGEFICDRIDCYPYGDMSFPTPAYDGDPTVCECGNGYYITCGELEKTCLEYKDLENYGKSKTLYGWHISDLKIYDKPKRLVDFTAPCKKALEQPKEECKGCTYIFKGTSTGELMCDRALMRPPQSWCYVEEL